MAGTDLPRAVTDALDKLSDDDGDELYAFLVPILARLDALEQRVANKAARNA